MSKPITDQSYELIPDVEDNVAIYTVKAKQKPWVDIVVEYGKIGLNVDEESGNAKLTFKYAIKSCPKDHSKQKLEQNKDFHKFLGDVLSHIINTALDSGNYVVGNPNKSKPIDVQSTPVDDPAEDRP